MSEVVAPWRPDFVLFDLDGTLSDSAPGIVASLRQAFAVLGVAPLDADQERALLGPPFYESLPALVGASRVPAIIDAYRGFYSAGGMYNCVVYDGIVDLADWLREQGVTLAVATSKPEHFAVPIVEHLGLAHHFATICGDTLEATRPTKALVIGEALHRLGNPDPNSVLMVGDRLHDVAGATAHGVRCFGAGWGYGGAGELQAAGALASYESPSDLRTALAGAGPYDAGCRSVR